MLKTITQENFSEVERIWSYILKELTVHLRLSTQNNLTPRHSSVQLLGFKEKIFFDYLGAEKGHMIYKTL